MNTRSCLVMPFLSLLSVSALLAQDVLITEVMTDNSSSLEDEDGDTPDWLELFNNTAAEINLEGYYLTDDVNQPTQWQFPAVKIGPKQFLVVFCSGENYRDPALPLHTSFKLAENDDDIFLIAADGRTIVSAIDNYPEQQADVSYGLATSSTFATPIKVGAAARVLVPSSPDLGLTWTQPDFDDAAWKAGTTAIGYGARSPELELVGTDVDVEMRNLNGSIYIRVPFDVADASAIDVLKLRLRYDDGFAAYVNGQLVASANTPAELSWNSVALRAHAPREYEVFDLASAIPALRSGRNVLAIHGLNQTANNTDFFLLPELDTVDIGETQPNVRWFFPVPTPGEPNGPGFPQAGPRPVFSLPSGAYVEARQLELSTELAGGIIRYTTDGTVPNETSTQYSVPIDIPGPRRITARVFKEGLAPGIPERNTFVILDPAAAVFTSNLPLVLFTTFGKAVGANCGGGPYTTGHLLLIMPGEDGQTVLSDLSELSSGAQIRRRGSSTCGNPKFAFNLEFLDAQSRDKTVQVFDYPRDSDYVMFGGNNFDRVMLRNPLAYWMSLQAGRWAARARFVECFLHTATGPVTATSYFGVYALMEKNKRNPDRVNIQAIGNRDKKEPEVTGGYLLRRDRVGPDETAISGGGYSSLVVVYPKVPNREQTTYLTATLNKAIASLNPNVGKQEDNLNIDFGAWVDHHILCWYPKNVDAFRLSGYFHKDRNGPVAMGPAWDYDRTMGCNDDARANTPEGWDNDASGDGGTRYFEAGGLGSWYSILFNNRPPITNTPWNVAYKNRWRELRQGPFATDNILGQIDAWALELTEPAARSNKKWPGQAFQRGGFQGEVNHLKNWLSRRADWIDAQFLESPAMSPRGGFVDVGAKVQITISDKNARLYYTIDGLDPRGPGNQPSPSATLYAEPVTIQGNTRLIARARFQDGAWSSLVEERYVSEILPLTITEIMYFPPAPSIEEDPQALYTAARMEYIEVANVGDKPISLTKVSFTKGVTFSFDNADVKALNPGEVAVIPRDKAAFAARYGTDGILVAGVFSGTLTDTGESIAVKGSFEEILFDFPYDDVWYPETNGGGHSLENRDPKGPRETLGEAARWRASTQPKGSPGRVEGLGGPAGILPGDNDRDGRLNVTDAILTLRMLFSGRQEGPCNANGLEDAANRAVLDWDGNARMEVTDVLLSLQYLFQEGPPHAMGVKCSVVADCADACVR